MRTGRSGCARGATVSTSAPAYAWDGRYLTGRPLGILSDRREVARAAAEATGWPVDADDTAIGIWGAPFIAELERAVAALDARQAGPQLGLWGGQ
jgi:hypothetical protein